MTKLIQKLILLTVIGLLLLLAPNLIGQQGYVLISLGNYTFEGSVISYFVALTIFALTIYAIWLVIKYLFVFVILPSKWLSKRNEKTHANYFQSGLDFMAMAQWQQATEQFLRVKRVSRIQIAQQLALVCAVRAESTELLNEVQTKVAINNQNAHELTSLMMLCQQKQYSTALERLNEFDINLLKKGLAFQQIWLEIQLNNFNWDEVKKHLLKINKQVEKLDDKAIQQEWLLTLQQHFTVAFQQYVKQNSVNQLLAVWQKLGKAIQHIAPISLSYLHVLSEQQQIKHIEPLLLSEAKLQSDEWLIDCLRVCYANIARVHMDQLFIYVQKKVTKDNKNKMLLTSFAYLAAGQKDNQLAKQALEQVIYSNNNKQDSILYANVLAELGELRHSLDVYQKLNP